ncbi:MAG: TolC family protein [Flavobacterium sp.]
MVRYCFWIGVLLVGTALHAQSPKKWTLSECVAYVLENNISIKQSELEVKTTDIEKMEAIGNFLPGLQGTANFGINTGANINPATNQFENETFKSASGNINSGVSLFNGLANWKNLQRSKLSKMAATYRLEKMKDDIMLNVANNYLQILLAKEQVKILKAQNQITQENIKQTRDLIDAGSLPAGDLYELLANDASQKQQIIVAENQLFFSKLALAQIMLLKDYYQFDVADEGFEVPLSTIYNETPENIAKKAKETVNDIKVAQGALDVAKKDLELSRTSYYPSLSAFAGYNTRWAQSIPFPFREQLFLFDGTTLGFQLTVPVLNGFASRGRVQRAKINIERNEYLLQQADLDLEQTIFQAYNDLIAAKKSYEAASATEEARKLAFDFSRERFNVGLMNSLDFNQSSMLFENAQAESVRAKYDLIFRIKVLEFYFGLPIIEKP